MKKIGNIEEAQVLLKELSSYWSVNLFFEKTQTEIDTQQIIDLLMLDDQECNPIDFHGLQIADFHTRLEKHPLFQKMNGHPHAISLIAPLAKENTLVEIYQLLHSKTFADSYKNSAHPLLPLKLSLDTSIKSMINKNPKAVELFCLIGLMPGGVTEKDLNVLWGSDWYGYISILMGAQLALKKTNSNETKYTLLPFMNYYSD